jgi:hypothetical protein
MANTIDGKLYSERTTADWKALPVLTCVCGQRFYQQVAGETDCDDCIACDEDRWPTYAAITRGPRFDLANEFAAEADNDQMCPADLTDAGYPDDDMVEEN